MKTRLSIIITVVSCVLMVSLHPSYAQYLGNSKTYSFVVDDKNPHEIRFQSHVTSFEEVFYDDDAQSIITKVTSNSQLSDNILLYLHADSFYELFRDSQQATPTDVLILLDGEEQEYDVLPKAPRNNYIIWEFKNMPNIQEIEIILTPERYRDNKPLQTFEKSFSITEKQVRYDIFYDITNASITDTRLNCNSSSFKLSILSDDDGTMQLDIPNSMFGGIFMVLVNDKEWDDVSIDGNVLTINFTKDMTTIEVLGTYYLGTGNKDGICDVVHDPPHSYIFPPLKQFKLGISIDEIQCKPDLQKMLKHDEIPVCVTHETAPKIAERGWSWVLDLELWEKNYLLIPATDYVIKTDEVTYGSQYMISGAIVSEIAYDQNANSLKILMSSPERGILQIVMPSGLLHLPSQAPFSYFVLANGEEAKYERLSPIVLKIPFDIGTEEIEIIGTY